MSKRSRAARRTNQRVQAKRNVTYAAIALAAVAVLGIVIAISLAFNARAKATVAGDQLQLSEDILASAAATDDAPTATVAPDAAKALIEVPDVCGMQLEEAETLLAVAGFSVIRVSTPAGEAAAGTVLAQEPGAGHKIAAGEEVSLIWADPDAIAEQSSTSSTANASGTSGTADTGLVVCLDPGHQAKANLTEEPVGPGSKETKPKVTGGATGAVTKQTEHALALVLANNIKARLEAKGITVVMTRVAADVDISNRQRAEVASNAGADLFVRIHADGSTNGDTQGISTLYPSGNSWVSPIEARSLRAAKLIQAATVSTTGATDRGLSPRGDIAGFNWSKVPAVLVETGFLSSPVEDRLLATGEYQDKIAEGIAQGILQYLGVE